MQGQGGWEPEGEETRCCDLGDQPGGTGRGLGESTDWCSLTDPMGNTPLHWAGSASVPRTLPSVPVSYWPWSSLPTARRQLALSPGAKLKPRGQQKLSPGPVATAGIQTQACPPQTPSSPPPPDSSIPSPCIPQPGSLLFIQASAVMSLVPQGLS